MVNLTLNILYGPQVTGIRTDVDGMQLGILEGDGTIDIIVPNLYLLPNIYTIDAVLFHKDGFTFYDRMNRIAHLKVRGGNLINGTAYLPHQWNFNNASFPAVASPINPSSDYHRMR